MSKFIITTDSACDCSKDELIIKDVSIIPFEYSDGSNTIMDKMEISNYKQFYDDIRHGVFYKTTQINPQRYYDFFKGLLNEGLPIVHVTLGSGLSNTINSIYIAINMLKDEFPTCNIKVVDSKLASLGLTIMVNKLIELRDQECDVDYAYDEVQKIIQHTIAYYTTDTLTYFARGGRLSKVEALIGNAFKINPILDCDPAGHLRIVDKVRGSKKAVQQLINRVKDMVLEPENQTIYVCHADALDKGNEIGQMLVEQCGFKNYKLYFMGPIIGAHTGPGLVAVFFIGKPRPEGIKPVKSKE